MKRHLLSSCLYTLITSLVLGLGYPLLVTAIAQLTMRHQAEGELIHLDGRLVGSALIGQSFTGPGFFHSRPSAAGSGYDASASSGSNYGPTSKALIERVAASVQAEQSDGPVPVDLVTASGSGLDPDITPAAAFYQVVRVARERQLPETAVRNLVEKQTQPRQFGLFGEAHVNVLALNLALDQLPHGDTKQPGNVGSVGSVR